MTKNDLYSVKNPKLAPRVKYFLIRSGITTIADLASYLENNKINSIKQLLPADIRRLKDFIKELDIRNNPLTKNNNKQTANSFLEKPNIPSIEKLNLSIRSYNALRRNGISTIEELLEKFDQGTLLKLINIGEKMFLEIQNSLEEWLKSTEVVQQEGDVEKKDKIDQNKRHQRSLCNNDGIERLGLSIRTYNSLCRNKINTIEKLLDCINQEKLLEVRNIGPKSIDEILHSLNSYELITISSTKLPINPEQNQTWAEIIKPFLIKLNERRLYIFLHRFGSSIYTLEKISASECVTRERIRQIQSRLARNLILYIASVNNPTVLENIYKTIKKLGYDLSLSRLKVELQRNKLLGKFDKENMPNFFSRIDVFELLICWLTIATERKYLPDNVNLIGLPCLDMSSLKNSKSTSLRTKNVMENLTKKRLRKVTRKIIYTGGIKLNDVSKILDIEEEVAKLVIDQLKLVEVIPNWYTYNSINSINQKVPIRLAGIKMLNAVKEMEFEVFYLGLERYIARFYEPIAPREIILFLFKLMKFEIIDNKICLHVNYPDALSKSEKVFISAIKNNDGLVSLVELAELFFKEQFSLPAVTAVLTRSPIVEKPAPGLYKIRGSTITWEQLEIAQKRQKRFPQNEEITFGLDGIIKMRLSITNYAFLTGIITSYKLKDLIGEWKVINESQQLGLAKMDDMFLWGLLESFHKNNVQIGDRLELSFNTWKREIYISKVG